MTERQLAQIERDIGNLSAYEVNAFDRMLRRHYPEETHKRLWPAIQRRLQYFESMTTIERMSDEQATL